MRSAPPQKNKQGRVRIAQYVCWLNSLGLKPPITDIFEDVRSGVLLCRIIEALVPGLQLTGIHSKAMNATTAIANIEKAVSVVWKKGVNAKHMPTAQDIYKGKFEAVAGLLHELFDVFVMRDLEGLFDTMLWWYHDVTAAYGLQLPLTPGESYSLSTHFNMLSHFNDCGLWIATLHAYSTTFTPDTLSLADCYWRPNTQEEIRSNANRFHTIMQQYGLKVFFTAEELLKHPNVHFVFVQSFLIYHTLKDEPRQAVDPTALDYSDMNRLHFYLTEKHQQQALAQPTQHAANMLLKFINQGESSSGSTSTNSTSCTPTTTNTTLTQFSGLLGTTTSPLRCQHNTPSSSGHHAHHSVPGSSTATQSTNASMGTTTTTQQGGSGRSERSCSNSSNGKRIRRGSGWGGGPPPPPLRTSPQRGRRNSLGAVNDKSNHTSSGATRGRSTSPRTPSTVYIQSQKTGRARSAGGAIGVSSSGGGGVAGGGSTAPSKYGRTASRSPNRSRSPLHNMTPPKQRYINPTTHSTTTTTVTCVCAGNNNTTMPTQQSTVVNGPTTSSNQKLPRGGGNSKVHNNSVHRCAADTTTTTPTPPPLMSKHFNQPSGSLPHQQQQQVNLDTTGDDLPNPYAVVESLLGYTTNSGTFDEGYVKGGGHDTNDDTQQPPIHPNRIISPTKLVVGKGVRQTAETNANNSHEVTVLDESNIQNGTHGTLNEIIHAVTHNNCNHQHTPPPHGYPHHTSSTPVANNTCAMPPPPLLPVLATTPLLQHQQCNVVNTRITPTTALMDVNTNTLLHHTHTAAANNTAYSVVGLPQTSHVSSRAYQQSHGIQPPTESNLQTTNYKSTDGVPLCLYTVTTTSPMESTSVPFNSSLIHNNNNSVMVATDDGTSSSDEGNTQQCSSSVAVHPSSSGCGGYNNHYTHKKAEQQKMGGAAEREKHNNNENIAPGGGGSGMAHHHYNHNVPACASVSQQQQVLVGTHTTRPTHNNNSNCTMLSTTTPMPSTPTRQTTRSTTTPNSTNYRTPTRSTQQRSPVLGKKTPPYGIKSDLAAVRARTTRFKVWISQTLGVEEQSYLHLHHLHFQRSSNHNSLSNFNVNQNQQYPSTPSHISLFNMITPLGCVHSHPHNNSSVCGPTSCGGGLSQWHMVFRSPKYLQQLKVNSNMKANCSGYITLDQVEGAYMECISSNSPFISTGDQSLTVQDMTVKVTIVGKCKFSNMMTPVSQLSKVSLFMRDKKLAGLLTTGIKEFLQVYS